MRRHPPQSTRTYTLFPYTTLFLSEYRTVCKVALGIVDLLQRISGDQPVEGKKPLRPEFDQLRDQQLGHRIALDDEGNLLPLHQRLLRQVQRRDRKSTRLNSSH